MEPELISALRDVSGKIQSASTLFDALCKFNDSFARWRMIYGHWHDRVWQDNGGRMIAAYLKTQRRIVNK